MALRGASFRKYSYDRMRDAALPCNCITGDGAGQQKEGHQGGV